MIFIIPLRSEKTSKDWIQVCYRLQSTINSILNQNVFQRKIHIVVAGHERPFFLDDIKYQQVIFLEVPFSRPESKDQYMLDKLNKRKFASIFCKNHLFGNLSEKVIMQLDADDIIHPEFVSNIYLEFEQDKSLNDIALMSGYAFDFRRRKLAYLNGKDKIFYRNCGSCFVSKVTKQDLPDSLESACYFNYLANHVRYPEIAERNNRKVGYVFNDAVMYLVNHGSNDVSDRDNGENIINSFINQFSVEINNHPRAISMINSI